MKTTDIPHLRLYNQHISQQQCKKPAEVVAWLGAMQAQDYPGAKRSIALRLPNATESNIEQAIADKAIVRTWPLRGTLHFVTAKDLRWMLTLVAPRTIANSARRYRELELDEATLKRGTDLIVKALEGGKELNRKQLLDMLNEQGISTEGQRSAYLLSRASLDGLVCQGVMQGNYPTYMLIDEAIPKTKSMPRDEALAELARRYFTSRGPTTLPDFIAWSGLPNSEARAGLESIKSELVEEKIDGKTYWLSPVTKITKKRSPSLYLLPGFDEYLLGYRDRSPVLDPAHANKIVPGGNGIFKPTIVIDGQVVGIWSRTIKKRSVVVTAHPFRGLTAAEKEAFATAAQHYGDYLQLSVTVS